MTVIEASGSGADRLSQTASPNIEGRPKREKRHLSSRLHLCETAIMEVGKRTARGSQVSVPRCMITVSIVSRALFQCQARSSPQPPSRAGRSNRFCASTRFARIAENFDQAIINFGERGAARELLRGALSMVASWNHLTFSFISRATSTSRLQSGTARRSGIFPMS